jgi:hypothetical protein
MVSVIGVLLLNLVFTITATYVSTLNYPGGQALHSLHLGPTTIGGASIYIDNLAAQTGASLFLQSGSPPFTNCPNDGLAHQLRWTYDKQARNHTDFTHVIVEDASKYLSPALIQSLSPGRIPFARPGSLVHRIDDIGNSPGSWRPLAIVYGFDDWGRNHKASKPSHRYTPIPFVAPKLWILQRV